MSYAPLPTDFGMQRDPELEPFALVARVALQALRLNDKLLAERGIRVKTRRRTK